MRMDSPVKDPIDIIDNKFEENEEPGSPIIRDEEKRSNDGNKILIIFHAVGSAPVLKPNRRKWNMAQDRNMAWVNSCLKKLIKCNPPESLFLYVDAFAPAPDETLKSLFDCFGVEGALHIHYCKTQAWG